MKRLKKLWMMPPSTGLLSVWMPESSRSIAARTQGEPTAGDGHAYELVSADLFFTAGIAQHTLFFADIVGLSGPNPEGELQVLTLVNGYSARLVSQNDISLREAWLRTELFGQKLGGDRRPARPDKLFRSQHGRKR